MKALTIKEPFASLIMKEYKKIETRSWKTNYRGKILIHAGLAKVNRKDKHISTLLGWLNDEIHPGMILCVATLKDCIIMDENFLENIKKNKQEYLCGHYELGRYAWVLEDIKPICPIEYKGQLGLWNYEGEINEKN